MVLSGRVRVLGALSMLYDLSDAVAECYRRAAECKELAKQADTFSSKAFYLERERAWLRLARSVDFSERVNRILNERKRQRARQWPPPRPRPPRVMLPKCSTCKVEMRVRVVKPELVQDTRLVFEQAYVLCPNCGRVGNYLCD